MFCNMCTATNKLSMAVLLLRAWKCYLLMWYLMPKGIKWEVWLHVMKRWSVLTPNMLATKSVWSTATQQSQFWIGGFQLTPSPFHWCGISEWLATDVQGSSCDLILSSVMTFAMNDWGKSWEICQVSSQRFEPGTSYVWSMSGVNWLWHFY